MGYVIKDNDDRYVLKGAFLFTENEWMYVSFTGRDSGFSYCLNEIQAKVKKDELQKISDKYRFGKIFRVEYIENIKKIPIGKLIIDKILSPKQIGFQRCNNF